MTNAYRRWPLMLSICLDHLSLNVTFPVLSFIFFDQASRLFPADTSHATRSLWYGLCLSLPSFIGIISTPLMSFASDYWGRKKMLVIGAFGALVYALFLSAGIMSGLVVLLLIGYIIGGFCSRTEPIALAMIADVSPPEKRVMSIAHLQVMIALGAFLGPIIGGHFAHSFAFDTVNFALPSIIAGGFAFTTVVVMLLFLRETNKANISIPSLKSSLHALFQKSIFHLVLILFLIQISWSTYYQFIPTVLKLHWNISADHVGLFVGLIAAWLVLATTVGIHFLKRYFTDNKIFLIGIGLLFFGLLLSNVAIFSHQLWLIWAAAPFTAAGDVTAYCILVHYFAQSVSMQDQGKVMGLIFIVVSVAWAVTGLFGGMLGAVSATLPILFSPLAVGALVIFNKCTRSGILKPS